LTEFALWTLSFFLLCQTTEADLKRQLLSKRPQGEIPMRRHPRSIDSSLDHRTEASIVDAQQLALTVG